MRNQKGKRVISWILAVSLLFQAVLMNFTLPVRAGGDEAENLFYFDTVTLKDKDGNNIAGTGATVNMADPVYVRYSFIISNGGVPGKYLDIQIPDAIGIYDNMSFKLVDSNKKLKFAEVKISQNGIGRITLLEDSKRLNNLNGWFEIETFWKASDSGEEFPVVKKVEFQLGVGKTKNFDITVEKPDITTADTEIEKTGKYDPDSGEIEWTVKVIPATSPIKFPIMNVVVTDLIPADQKLIKNSWTIAAEVKETLSVNASYGFQSMTSDEIQSANDRHMEKQATASNADSAATGSNATVSDANMDLEAKEYEEEFTLPRLFRIRRAIDLKNGFKVPGDLSEITYAFAGGIQDPYIIKYRTRPNSSAMKQDQYSGDGLGYTFKNEAKVSFPENALSEEPEDQIEKTAKAEVVYPIDYIEKDGKILEEKGEVLWTVTVNKSGMAVQNASVEDKIISDFLDLDTGRVRFNGELLELCNTAEGTGPCNHSPGHFTYDSSERIIQYDLGNTAEMGRLTYYTVINPEKYAIAAAGGETLQNQAWFHGNGMDYTKGATVLNPAGQWIKKTGEDYSPVNHQVTWKVVVNSSRQKLEHAILKDELPREGNNAQSYIEGSFKISPSCPDGVLDTADGTLTYTFPDSITQQYTVEFKTELKNTDDYQANKNGRYSNTASLTATYRGREITVSSEGTQEVESSVIEKTGSYDHKNHIITWNILANKNRMPIYNAIITDKIPKDQELIIPDGADVKDAVIFNGIHPPDGYTVDLADDGTLTVSLCAGMDDPKVINEAYDITLKTRVKEDILKEYFGKNNGPDAVHIKNEASIKGDGIAPVTVTADLPVENQIVGKKAIYEEGDSAIVWQILINQHKMPISLPAGTDPSIADVCLEDKLAPGLTLDLDSVRFYKGVEIAENGDYAIGDSTVEIKGLTFGSGEKSGNIHYNPDPDGDVMRFCFMTPALTITDSADVFGSSNYLLEFKTDISDELGKNGATISNTISLKGLAADSLNSNESQKIQFSNGAGGGNGTRATLRIAKVDKYAHSMKLEGAEFSLEDTDAAHEDLKLDPVKKTTGTDGNAEYSMLYFNTEYELKEIASPAGYVENTGLVTNDKITDGKVVLDKENLIQNTLTLTVENTPKLGWIELTKKSGTPGIDKALEGAEYKVVNRGGANPVGLITDLSAADGAPKAAVAKTDVNGKVRFVGLRCGEYDLVETKAPEGYALDTTPIPFTISDRISEGIITQPDGMTNPPEDTKGTFDDGFNGVAKNDPVGSIEIKKVDSQDESIAVSGAQIALYKTQEDMENSRNAIASKWTSSDGKVKFDGLKAGNYYLKEIKAPKNYQMIVDEWVSVKLETDGSDKVIQKEYPNLKNKPVGSFKLIKQDLYDNRLVAGAKIQLEGPDSYKETKLTDAKGAVIFGNLPFGTYIWTETQAAPGYVLGVDSYNKPSNIEGTVATQGSFTITRDNFNRDVSETVNLKNRPILGTYLFTKTDNENMGLEGVKFGIYSDQNCTRPVWNEDVTGKQHEFVSGVNGMVKIEFLRPGTYYCKELAGVAGYEDEALFKFEIPGTIGDQEEISRSEPIINWKSGARQIQKKDAVTGNVITTSEAVIQVWAVDVSGNKLLKSDPRFYDKIHTTVKGILTLSLKEGAYKYKEIESPRDYQLDSSVREFTVRKGDKESQNISILENTPLGSIKVRKVDALQVDSGIKGAEISLYSDADCQTKVSGPVVTGEDGYAVFDNLPVTNSSVYYVKEVSAPEGYQINRQAVKCSLAGVPAGTQVNSVLKDMPTLAKIQVRKIDAQSASDSPLAVRGAKLGLYEKGSDTPLQTQISDLDGYVLFENIRVGSYIVKETEAPQNGHYLVTDEELAFTVTDGEDGEIIDRTDAGKAAVLKDEPVGSFTLRKVSSADPDMLLPGAVIKLTDKTTGAEVGTVVADKGVAKFENLVYGTYVWEEVKSPDGYIMNPDLSEEERTIVIDAPGQDASYTLENRPVPTFNYLVKKTGDPSDGLGGRLLSGAVIGVYKKDGTLVSTAVTSEGIALFKGLLCGVDYYYQEISAPDGYRLDPARHEFKIEDSGTDEVRTISNAVLTNSLKKGSFRLVKIDSSLSANPIMGVKFEVTYLGKGASGAENPILDSKVWSGETDVDGNVIFHNLPLGEYKCREISAPKEYHVDKDWSYTFSVTEDLQEVQYDNGVGGAGFVNFGPYRGSLELLKTDAGNKKPLSGAVFGIFLASNGTKVMEGVSGQDGKVKFEPLYDGDYYYQELTAPYGYALDDTKHVFSISAAQENLTEEVTNDLLITGTFELTKKGEDGSALAGAEIGLYKTGTGGNGQSVLIETQTTGEDGKAWFHNLRKDEQDQYYYQELTAPQGYLLDTERHPLEFPIQVQGEIVKEELINYKEKGSLELLKVDGSSGRLLKGAVITVFTQDGTAVAKVTTDENGMAVFAELPVGDYYYEETAAPDGYVKNIDKHEFSIAGEGQIIKETLENQKQESGGSSGNSGGGGSSTIPPDYSKEPGKEEVGPGIPTDPAEEDMTAPEDTIPEMQEPVVNTTQEENGITTIQVPAGIETGAEIQIIDMSGEELFRGRADENGQIRVELPPGAYNLVILDDEGVPLASTPFTIEDEPVPLARSSSVPDAGDHSMPAALLAVIMLGAASGMGILLVKRKKILGSGNKK